MEFFAREDRARTATTRLLWMFIACMALMVAVISAATWYLVGLDPRLDCRGAATFFAGLGTAAVILVASAWKKQTRSAAGARRWPRWWARAWSRRILLMTANACSTTWSRRCRSPPGTPLPRVYAHCSRSQRSTPSPRRSSPPMRPSWSRAARSLHLTRDELQGVVAHEFSHLLNGDCRLNIRLISWAFGLLVVGLTGRMLLRFLGSGSGGSLSGEGRRPGPARHPGDRRDAGGGRLHRLVVRPVKLQGRHLPPARVPGRRLGGAIHAQSGRHRRRAQEIGPPFLSLDGRQPRRP